MNQAASSFTAFDEKAATAGMYRLLARFWLHEVDASLLNELRSPALYECFTQAGGVLPEPDCDQAIDELAADYCQLFIGPSGHLPPFQSVWQTGQFQGDATASMNEWIEVVGYESAAVPYAKMPDHLGVQLDVMSQVVSQCSTARRRTEQVGIANQLPRAFHHKHLSWSTPLLDAAIERADSVFYRAVIQLTKDFLLSEQSYWQREAHSV